MTKRLFRFAVLHQNCTLGTVLVNIKVDLPVIGGPMKHGCGIVGDGVGYRIVANVEEG